MVLSLTVASAQVTTPPPNYPTDWKTKDGTEYHGVKVLGVDGDYVNIMHRDGVGNLALSALTPDLQRLFNYPHPLSQGVTVGGIRYKDLTVGTGNNPQTGDTVTVTITTASADTQAVLNKSVDAERTALTAERTSLEASRTGLQTSYNSATGSAADKILAQLNALGDQEKDLDQRLASLHSYTFTYTFGKDFIPSTAQNSVADVLPGLKQVIATMKPGGKRSTFVLGAGPTLPAPTPDPSVKATPGPTPTPAPMVTPQPYDVELVEVVSPTT